MRDDFAVLILSHGRAGNIKTLKALKDGNYTGKIFILCDDQDDQLDDYRRLYGDMVVVFCKAHYIGVSDYGDAGGNNSVVLWARNACHDIARELGLKYFLELDDDYNAFNYRVIENGKILRAYVPRQLNRLFGAMVKWLEDSKALVVAMTQAGDFIGGAKNKRLQEKVLRKAMNCFFCDVDKPFQFFGRINEDTSMYTTLGRQGKLIMSCTDLSVVQTITQKAKGGLTEIYLETGTYTKSFYSVMYCPSCVKVAAMGDKHKRVHHKINWNACAPKILSDKWKKRE